ncbi:MAG: Asp-tRNA(Asn)/Glu-tRNA(Gln) amidotransferase subunit GatC [Candidatus Paceibacterota bacterium]
MISNDDVKKIAKLSYLKLNEEELQKMEKDFSSILDYVNKLSELDASKIEETANLSIDKNVFREDEPCDQNNEAILKLMPHTKNNYLEVKKILGK